MDNPVPYVVIHHSEGRNCTTKTECINVVKTMQINDMNNNEWADIGFNFLVGGDGNIYEGRGWERVGTHATGYNSLSIGICFLGDYSTTAPDNTMVDPVLQLIQCGMDDGWITVEHMTIGHVQAVITDCPGDALYELIQTWPDFEPNP